MTTPLHAEPVVTVLNTTFHGNNLDGAPVIGGGPDGQTRLTLIGWTCFGPDEAGQAALYAAASPAPAVARERVPGCVCTFVGEWDGYSGVVAHHSGPWPVWIDKSCPVHGAAPTPTSLQKTQTSVPDPDEMREGIARSIARELSRQDYNPVPEEMDPAWDLTWSYIDQGHVDFGQIADAILALLAAPAQGGGQLSGNTGELAEAVEVVTEWLAMVETFTPSNYSRARHVPICQGEIDAIALLAKGP
jgi:hypothetical protein